MTSLYLLVDLLLRSLLLRARMTVVFCVINVLSDGTG